MLRKKTFRFSVFNKLAQFRDKSIYPLTVVLPILTSQFMLTIGLILVSHNSIFPIGLSLLPGGIGSIIPGNNIMSHSGQGAGGTQAIEAAVHHLAPYAFIHLFFFFLCFFFWQMCYKTSSFIRTWKQTKYLDAPELVFSNGCKVIYIPSGCGQELATTQ